MPAKTLITGASGGIGAVVTRKLAEAGQPVIMACRDLTKAERVRQQILADCPGAPIEIRPLDLRSLASVRTFTEGIGPETVGTLFHNAGVISRDFSLTGDGLENTFSVNYFAPFLLTRLLLPRLTPDAHVVCMVSLTCRFVHIDASSLRPGARDFSQLGTYARSKLALIHFAQELARRYPALQVQLADPGIVNSGIISMGRWFDPVADLVFRPLIKSPERGAVPPLAALASPGRNRLFRGSRCLPVPGCYRDPELQRRLWEETERVLAEHFR